MTLPNEILCSYTRLVTCFTIELLIILFGSEEGPGIT